MRFNKFFTCFLLCGCVLATTFGFFCFKANGESDNITQPTVLFSISSTHESKQEEDISKFRFHCEKDTAEIEYILTTLSKLKDQPLNEIILEAAKHLEGRPYVGQTLEGDEERLVINVDGLDCVTFVENCFALAKTAEAGSTSWRDHARNLEKLRYRNGQQQNFDSRLHYTSDWISDNIMRDNLTDVTTSIPDYKKIRKTLNFMTTHRDLYPALSVDSVFRGCKKAEESLRDITIPYISRYDAANPEVAEILETSDMISFVSNVEGLDSSHVALLRMVDGKPYMIHASMKKGKVVFETTPLHDYFRTSNRSAPGFRVVRLK